MLGVARELESVAQQSTNNPARTSGHAWSHCNCAQFQPGNDYSRIECNRIFEVLDRFIQTPSRHRASVLRVCKHADIIAILPVDAATQKCPPRRIAHRLST